MLNVFGAYRCHRSTFTFDNFHLCIHGYLCFFIVDKTIPRGLSAIFVLLDYLFFLYCSICENVGWHWYRYRQGKWEQPKKNWNSCGKLKIAKAGSMRSWAVAHLIDLLTLSSGVMSVSLCLLLLLTLGWPVLDWSDKMTFQFYFPATPRLDFVLPEQICVWLPWVYMCVCLPPTFLKNEIYFFNTFWQNKNNATLEWVWERWCFKVQIL